MTAIGIDEQRKLIYSASEFLQKEVNDHFKELKPLEPRVLIVCGSGLGGISNRLSSEPEPLIIPFASIPGFKVSTVPGHIGTLVFGFMNNTPVALMNGRLHSYEGHSFFDVSFPIRALNHMGCLKTLIVTNAAGGLNDSFSPCDLMCLSDHINYPGFAGNHPLRGPNFEEIGPRFLPMSDAYDLELRKLLFKKKESLKIERPLHEGTYIYVSGPTFETRAESRMLRMLGADAVGMSTVPEVIVARHCGWRILALSLITNKCVCDPAPSALDKNPAPMNQGIASHEEVLENGAKASLDVERLIEEVVGEL